MILSLPAELVQLILRSCDGPTYLQLAFCCHTLLDIASSSRELMLHQLCNTPGDTKDIDACSTTALFRLLLQRSYRHLYGTEFYTKRKLFDFQDKVIDVRASTLQTSAFQNRAVLAFEGHEAVYLADIRNGQLAFRCCFHSPARRFGTTEVLHTAFDENGVYVLHRFQPFPDKELDPSHPFVKQALQANLNGKIFLAYHELGSLGNPVRLYGFNEESEYEPLAFAAHGERFAISWQHQQYSPDHQVVLYTIADSADGEGTDDSEVGSEESEFDELEDEDAASTRKRYESPRIIDSKYASFVLTDTNEKGSSDPALEGRGPTMKLVFNDRGLQLLHHYKAHTLYSSFQRMQFLHERSQPRPPVKENACVVEYTDSLSLQFSIGIPFFLSHRTGDESPVPGSCHWQYLAVGIATHRVEHWTVACLLESEAYCQSRRCSHAMNLERGRRFDNWVIKAQLGGFQESSTSHGSIIAASHRGSRVAIANWKTVTVWALEPEKLIDDEENGYYPESWRLAANGTTELRPATIHLDAVCWQLRFTDREDENELVVITDRGLLFLDLRPDGRGGQVVEKQKSRGNRVPSP
ncbi:hypothetical protein N7462_006336 [Penicillium macrosclerotiorum]|uniref:uncharacterized protein n=1 Tax=Penicillium macrosclerotiorum TaxID=303699 RepID=UPI002547AC37|nr:uncharacterized protein N7462_006336 [Penicillium macrosclerotiorum]KAJ5683171.1 hypothetical protein N7462_006336 [Penicillium macrosclerotiorum]